MATGISPLDLELVDLEIFDRMVERVAGDKGRRALSGRRR